jgi:hypothetical protein
MVFPPLSGFFGLGLPTLAGFGLIGAATIISLALASPRDEPTRLTLPSGASPLPVLR